MTGQRCAVITVARGRHTHLARQEAGLARMHRPPDTRVLVAVGDPDIGRLARRGSEVLDLDCGTGALPLARARNAGARQAIDGGAELLIFLDVDCIPSPSLITDYLDAHHRAGRDALLCGPVTYLPPAPDGYDLDTLDELTDPHPARPVPAPGELLAADDHDLFWSLSFAVSASAWQRIGGFCEEYTGYGAEDTDFAAVARAAGVPLLWVGGAHAYHQHHPVSNPPVEHLRDIVANSAVFRRRWGRWPMPGWLDSFENDGLLRRDGDRITLTAG
ncbi:glycosyltransferase family 2 protein [Mycolicibacterium murale]|jgi:N-acetylglucosaminyl-diphospho-decaprenol L-rhamnosyltransferase|uniref:glycosyltransferase family 2 protein n=1 Tax=Mycolicibacterium murale TaxID=182220 RepID=UPI000811B849|nr:galactosyltransferase-related protein [Mycolicibacterium murale]ANW63106.1 sugar transferase [Mycobacterium sp. djl-10]MCV7185014.1 glycosyltransferase family 2 protein [Mycolicibacterium murale]